MRRILVVDDSASARAIAEAILSDAGYQVRSAADGKSAIEMLRREHFDLIVTDIYMPDGDGLDVIREGRRTRRGIPVVAISGVTGHRNMLPAAKHLGACQTVQKPFSCADLVSAVEAALGGNRR